MTQRIAYLLAAALLLAGSLAAHAGESKFVQRTYPVADLVVPFDNHLVPPSRLMDILADKPAETNSQTTDTLEDRLMKLIVGSIAPHTWTQHGGEGSIDYFPLGMAIVVRQTADVHEQIAELLECLRRHADKEVSVEVRVLSIGEHMAQQLLAEHGIDCMRCRKSDDAAQVTILDDLQVFQLFEAMQGDRQTQLMHAPKMTLFNGQLATSQVMDFQWFVTDVQIVKHGGSVVFVPQNQPIPFGLDMSLQPVLSGDEKTVRVHLNFKHTSLASDTVPLFPKITFITPEYEDGTHGQPVPFTQFIQQPHVATWSVNQVLNIPTNSTALLSGWKMDKETAWEVPAVLREIPYLKRLLTNRETQYMLLLVTPRLPKPEESVSTGVVTAPPPAIPPSVAQPEAAIQPVKYEAAEPLTPSDFLAGVRKDMAALLVRKYHQACRQGFTSDAKSLAEEALRLDPACFTHGQ